MTRIMGWSRADAFLRLAGALVQPALARFLPPGRAERAGEWLARVVLSYLCSPSATVTLTDAESVRRLVADFVAPGLTPSIHPARG